MVHGSESVGGASGERPRVPKRDVLPGRRAVQRSRVEDDRGMALVGLNHRPVVTAPVVLVARAFRAVDATAVGFETQQLIDERVRRYFDIERVAPVRLLHEWAAGIE